MSTSEHQSESVAAPVEVTTHAAPDSRPTPAAPSLSPLLDGMLAATSAHSETRSIPREDPGLRRFLETDDPVDAIGQWVERSAGREALSAKQALRRLNRDIARIDALVNSQVNAILHHPRFQKLEGSWRGLRYLCDQVDPDANSKVRVLDVSWRELTKDLDRAIEFDQSQLFKKVYSGEYGISGGEPFSVLLGDYEMHARPTAESRTDDLAALRSITQVAAAAFSPFITSAHPSLLGLDDFGELERPIDFARIHDQPEFVKWRSLREMEDSRFIGLTLPRVLMRRPHDDDAARADGFRYSEGTEFRVDEYVWGNACYAFGAVLARAFAETSWLADIRGVRRGEASGGLVEGLPAVSLATDREGVAIKSGTEVAITDVVENDLAANGFIPLCHLQGTEHAAFYSNSSIQQPREYDRETSTANARLSAMMQYVLCFSRVAHYVKVLGREKVGSFAEAGDIEVYLNDWLSKYVLEDDNAPAELKAEYPLREASVAVHETPGQPGRYNCIIHLQPHYQLDDLASTVRLSTELRAAGE